MQTHIYETYYRKCKFLSANQEPYSLVSYKASKLHEPL